MAKKSPLAENLDSVRERMAAAATKARHDPADVTLVAVTKHASPEQVREILALGVTDLGENRVQQLVQRAGQTAEFLQRRQSFGEGSVLDKVRWHLIGHLQRNKVKMLLPAVSLIQSVDSLRLAEELDTVAEKAGKKVPVLLQVNSSEESQKSGVAVGAALHLAEQMGSMPGLQMAGLMTLAEHDAPEAKLRQTFARTRELFEEIRWQKIGGNGFRHLSMGMSDDFELAITEGATMVRVGSALFGGKVMDHEMEMDG